MKVFVLCSLGMLNVLTAHADLIWDNYEGWLATDKTIEAFEKESPDILELMNRAKVAQDEQAYKIALNNYKTVIKNHKKSLFAPEACFQSAIIHKTKKQYKLAFKELKIISEEYPSYYNLKAAQNTQFEIAELMRDGSRPYYWGVIPGLKDRMGSIELYEQIVKNAPFSEQAPLSLTNKAEVYFDSKEYVKAIDTLDRIIDGYPTSECAPLAYIRTGEIYESLVKNSDHDQGAIKEAINYYEDFLTIFKDHEKGQYVQQKLKAAKEKLAYSRINIGDFYFQSRKNTKAAILMYEEAIKAYPKSEAAIIAQKKINEIKNGLVPKKTPIDFLFGNYKRPTNEEWTDEAKLDNIDNKRFEIGTAAIDITNNSNQKIVRQLSEEDEADIIQNFEKSPDISELESNPANESIQINKTSIVESTKNTPTNPTK